MLFPDYEQTGVVYHVAPITDLDKILLEGISYNDKNTYKSKYLNFHKYIDSCRPKNVPNWVIREKAIYASLNFAISHCWHSHTVIMSLQINPDKCWIANENLANEIYEPFILKDIEGYEHAHNYLETVGEDTLELYWKTSLSFNDNLKKRKDIIEGYDAEVLIFHKVLPKDIKLLSIVSDHKIMTPNEWKEFFKGGLINGNR